MYSHALTSTSTSHSSKEDNKGPLEQHQEDPQTTNTEMTTLDESLTAESSATKSMTNVKKEEEERQCQSTKDCVNGETPPIEEIDSTAFRIKQLEEECPATSTFTTTTTASPIDSHPNAEKTESNPDYNPDTIAAEHNRSQNSNTTDESVSVNNTCTNTIVKANSIERMDGAITTTTMGEDTDEHNDQGLAMSTTTSSTTTTTILGIGEKSNEKEGLLSKSKSTTPSSSLSSSTMSSSSTTTTTTQKVTTLHFKSGLSLTISTESESNKKVIASAGKKRNTPSSLTTLPKLESGNNKERSQQQQQEGNDVDRVLHFSALSTSNNNEEQSSTQSLSKNKTATATTQVENQDAQRKEKAQRIAQSKMSASRAMSTQLPALPQSTKCTEQSPSSPSSLSPCRTEAEGNLLQHVCLVFTSALGIMNTEKSKNSKKKKNTSNSNRIGNSQDSEQIELLTVDPLYLRKESSGLQFLDDADSIIEAELKNLGTNIDHSNDSSKPRFLSGTLRISDDHKSESTCSPNWFSHFTDSEESCIPVSLILLAKIEQSIRESYNLHQKNVESTNSISNGSKDVKDVAKDNLNLVTPPSSPQCNFDDNVQKTSETVMSTEDDFASENHVKPIEIGEVSEKAILPSLGYTSEPTNDESPSSQSKPKKALSLPFLLPRKSQPALSKADSITDFLGSWTSFHEKKSINDVSEKNIRSLLRDVVNKAPQQWHQDAHKVLRSFALKDLLLVPLCSVLLILPPPLKLGVNQTMAYVRLLVSEWSQIINAGLNKVKDEMTHLESLNVSDSLVADLGSLLDGNAVAKPGNGRKKKRNKRSKKKRRRKVSTSSNIINSDEQKSNNTEAISSKETTKRNNEEVTNRTNLTTTINDCALSVISSVSVATEASRKLSVGESTSNQPVPSLDVAKTSKTISAPQVNSVNGIGEGSKVDETDNHSSDGWETVEPKGGRSRRLAHSSSRNHEKHNNDSSAHVPQSPNSGRRNKGKGKTRQRTKQKTKEKDLPKRGTDTLEEGIIKRGSNTIKALMEERSKRPSEDPKKKKTEALKQVSARSSIADQNTAQTIPESLSGVSSAPVQTLVGPGNNNSASSSVASSLDAPHATRHKPHHHHDSCKEDDVGYHLLKVCDRLSSDMNTFMKRRASALTLRRRERGALLAALQDSVQNVWAGQCLVEMYGSCATQLDLPSSDLDVVIRGLDGSENLFMPQNRVGKCAERERSSSVEIKSNSFEGRERNSPSPPSTSPNMSPRPYMSYPQNFYPPLSANGNRVLRLANELERQPWAVQVKAIPTASVPVIKILSDPSRLPGAASGIEWMLHQQHMAAAAVAAAELKMAGGMPRNTPNSYHGAQLSWRGADVMNGLLSLDITFEGPEHGGVGSTAFSAQVVHDVVSETGLPPDSTPAVQVIMVIKELLAQRRLNEPFSGGLSSYAILLLVVAVLKERQIIREEIERVEKQQRAVALECTAVKSQKKTLVKKSSWAAIAKKSSSTQNSVEVSSAQTSNSKEIKNEMASKKRIPTLPLQENGTQSSGEGQSAKARDTTPFPQGSNDVLEVLCSGEPTAGKLLMHFLLFYGRHFDARTTCIDVSGTHHPEYTKIRNDLMKNYSPYMNRKPGGTHNPVTDVYTVDPFVVYDPLEGRESNNVARSCYAWPTISWTFDQCFNTLSGVVELGSETNNDKRGRGVDKDNGNEQIRPSESSPPSDSRNSPQTTDNISNGIDTSCNVDSDVSPLLELLLCF